MEWVKRIGFGIIIWAAIFVAISVLVAFNLDVIKWLSYTVAWLIVIILGWYLSGMLELENIFSGILTGIIWIIVGLILDYFITLKFVGSGTAYFKEWNLIVGYLFTLIVPLLRASNK